MTTIDVFMDRIYSKNPQASQDTELELKVMEYIRKMEIDRYWQESGLPDRMLERFLQVYLAPIDSLSYDETVNFFTDSELLFDIDVERRFFHNLDRDSGYTEAELRRRYNALRDMCAPLLSTGRYDEYLSELFSLARVGIDRAVGKTDNG